MFLPTDLRHCLDSVEGGPDKRFKGVAGTSDSPKDLSGVAIGPARRMPPQGCNVHCRELVSMG